MNEDKMIEWVEISLFGDDNNMTDDESNDYLENEHQDDFNKIKLNRLVQTPLGIFTSDDSFHPLRDLPVYMAHLNFPVLKSMLPILDEVPGIESFKVIGRYRIAFIFAKLFREEDVMDSIEAALGITQDGVIQAPDEELPEKAKDILRDIQKHIESEHWVLYVFPNGKYKLLNLESREEVEKEQESFLNLKKVSGGIVYSSILME